MADDHQSAVCGLTHIREIDDRGRLVGGEPGPEGAPPAGRGGVCRHTALLCQSLTWAKLSAMGTPATFYFDIGSPYAYLAAERVDALIPGVRWQPISLGGLFKTNGRSSWALGDRWRRDLGMHEIERRALRYGLAPIRWPEPWPSRYLTVMRAATFAFSIEHGPSFALAAFRAMFAEGIDLALETNVLKVAWDAGLDPQEVREAVGDPAVKSALHAATDAAHADGVIGVPTVSVGRRRFWGDDELENAAASWRAQSEA